MRIFFITILITTNFIRAEYSVSDAFPAFTFTNPVGIETAGDGSNLIFVIEQPGRIYTFENDPNVTERFIFLDIRNIVNDNQNEEGLLGLTFHPNYAENGYFYVNYTDYSPKRNVIARYQVNPENPQEADENSALIILEVNQPYWNHNGGQMGFGPDGYLYIIFGDGGSSGDPQSNGQNLQTLLASLLRIDVDNPSNGFNYGIPPDNPFINDSNARDEIYAYGLRNMWRFSWDPVTNWLWGSDVGQNAWEEIDIIYPGLNYGWNTMEGNHCYSPPTGCDQTGLELPIWEYELYVEGDCSITGGYVYRGSQYFSISGKYIYGDYCSGRIWALDYNGESPAQNEELLDTELYISSFGLDQNNEILLCGLGTGKIYRFTSDEPGGLGDVSQDGATDVLDIIQSINLILGSTPSPYQAWSADINMDGLIDILDIVLLVNLILSD